MFQLPRLFILIFLIGLATLAIGQGPSQLQELSVRASEINPNAREHPKIRFIFKDEKGKVLDLQHAVVDASVPARGQLVIWMMGHNKELSGYLGSLGFHYIQPHYANRWFSTVPKEIHDTGECLGNIRLEAATGEDHSPLVNIPKPDGLAYQIPPLRKMACEEPSRRKMGTIPEQEPHRPTLGQGDPFRDFPWFDHSCPFCQASESRHGCRVFRSS